MTTRAVPGPPTPRQKENQVPSPHLSTPLRPLADTRPDPLGLSGPQIRVSRSVGRGPTRLAAFDAALVAAGLQDFNLVPLSSVVPLGASVDVVAPAEQLRGQHGDLLYCVYAAGYATTPGAEAWAGVAWGLQTNRSGAGLFVEHSGPSESVVQADLSATLGAMMANRPEDYVEAGRLVSSATCTDQPVAALVVASFQTAGWAPAGAAEGTR